MNFELIVDVEFGVMDAAVNECLPGYAPAGWVEFTRREITPRSVEYDMYLQEHGDLGDLGLVSVRDAGEGKSILYFKTPVRPTPDRPSQEEWASHNFAQYPREERLSKKLKLLNKYREEANQLYDRRRDHQKKIIQALFSRLGDDVATEAAFATKSPPESSKQNIVDAARNELQQFVAEVERQFAADLLEDGGPKESQARGLLQAYIRNRSYREVPVRGGRSDILVTLQEGRILYETKIWHGKRGFNAGLDEIEEYVLGENTDGSLLIAFYVVFDPTKTHRANAHLGSTLKAIEVSGCTVEVYVVNLSLPTPSKKGFA